MSDAERTTIIGAAPAGYGYADEWDGDDEAARKREAQPGHRAGGRRAVLIGGAIAIALAVGGGGGDEPPAVAQVAVPELVAGRPRTRPPRRSPRPGSGRHGHAADQHRGAEGHRPQLRPGRRRAGRRGPVVAGGRRRTEHHRRAERRRPGPGRRPVRPGVRRVHRQVSTDQVDSLEPEGTVVAIDPAVGSQAAPDTAIRLGVSTGTIDAARPAGPDRGRGPPAAGGRRHRQRPDRVPERRERRRGRRQRGEQRPGPAVRRGHRATPITLLIAVPVPSRRHDADDPSRTPRRRPRRPPATTATPRRIAHRAGLRRWPT